MLPQRPPRYIEKTPQRPQPDRETGDVLQEFLRELSQCTDRLVLERKDFRVDPQNGPRA